MLGLRGDGHSSLRCAGLSLSRPLLLWSTGSRRAGSVVVAHGPSCSEACGIFPDQGSNPCPLHRQADFQPLHHQGSPPNSLLIWHENATSPHWNLALDFLTPMLFVVKWFSLLPLSSVQHGHTLEIPKARDRSAFSVAGLPSVTSGWSLEAKGCTFWPAKTFPVLSYDWQWTCWLAIF